MGKICFSLNSHYEFERNEYYSKMYYCCKINVSLNKSPLGINLLNHDDTETSFHNIFKYI